MSRFDESKFVEINIHMLCRRCQAFADSCIESGDILPPVSWFKNDDKSLDPFVLFDMTMQGRIARLYRRVWMIIQNEEHLPSSLPNLFIVRCMGLLAVRNLKMSFLNHYDSTKNIIMAANDNQAFYWALTSFYRYSDRDERAVIWHKEQDRLMYAHDIALLTDKWQRGKTGKDLELEQAQRREREARQKWKQSVQEVKRLKKPE